MRKIIPSIIFFLISATLAWCAPSPEITHNALVMPKTFDYEGKKFKVKNDTSVDRNITITHDLDGDGTVEVLVGFQSYQQVEENKIEIPVSFFVIGKQTNGEFVLDHVFRGNDYFDKVELKDVDNDGLSDILFWQSGGAHYTSLDIFKYSKGSLQQIFSNGSACEVAFENNNGVATIKIGRAKWREKGWSYASGNPLWEVYQWSSGKFQYAPKLSTTQPILEQEEVQRYVDVVKRESK